MARSGRKCTVCSRPDVQTINKRLVRKGASIRRIAADFNVSESAMGRHFRNDVPKTVEAAKAQKQETQAGFDILGWVQADREAIEEVRERARARTRVVKIIDETGEGVRYEEQDDPDDRLILESVRASAKLAEVAARVQGDIPAEVGEVTVKLSMNERAEETG